MFNCTETPKRFHLQEFSCQQPIDWGQISQVHSAWSLLEMRSPFLPKLPSPSLCFEPPSRRILGLLTSQTFPCCQDSTHSMAFLLPCPPSAATNQRHQHQLGTGQTRSQSGPRPGNRISSAEAWPSVCGGLSQGHTGPKGPESPLWLLLTPLCPDSVSLATVLALNCFSALILFPYYPARLKGSQQTCSNHLAFIC